MELVHGALVRVNVRACLLVCACGCDRRQSGAGQITSDRVRNHEISIRKPLHERTGAKAVGAVIRKVGFPQHKQAIQVAHQVVVHP